jgi:hypothetical protein
MATGHTSPLILADPFGRAPLTMVRVLQELRRMVEPELRLGASSPGGGKSAYHYGLDDLGGIMIAAMASAPKEGPKWLRALRAIRCVRERVEQPLDDRVTGYTQAFRPGSGERLRDYLSRQIETLGDAAERAARTERYGQSWRLMASPDPAHASVSWTEPDGTKITLEFEPEAEPDLLPQPAPPPRPYTARVLTWPALAACGVAWADTLAHRPQQPSFSNPGTGSTTAGPESESAEATTAPALPRDRARQSQSRIGTLPNPILAKNANPRKGGGGLDHAPAIQPGADPPWPPPMT